MFQKRETLPSLERKNFIRKGFDGVMEDITAEDITPRSAGVGFLQVGEKEVREERLRYFIPLDCQFWLSQIFLFLL